MSALFVGVCIAIGGLVVATLRPGRLTEPTHATFACSDPAARRAALPSAVVGSEHGDVPASSGEPLSPRRYAPGASPLFGELQ